VKPNNTCLHANSWGMTLGEGTNMKLLGAGWKSLMPTLILGKNGIPTSGEVPSA